MDARRVLDLLSHAELVEVADIPPVSRNPKDDIFLATAVVGEAEVPRNKIVDVATFLKILTEGKLH